MYPDNNPDQSQNLMRSTLDQDPAFDIFQEDPTSSICVMLLTNKQTNTHTERQMFMKIIPSRWR